MSQLPRRLRWVVGLGGLVLLLGLVPVARATADDSAAKQVELKKGDKVLFFGDSLTALAVKDRHVPTGKGYVPLVREALKDKGVEVDAGEQVGRVAG